MTEDTDDIARAQRAALDMIDATRRFLDVLERNVADRERAEQFVDRLREVAHGLGTALTDRNGGRSDAAPQGFQRIKFGETDRD